MYVRWLIATLHLIALTIGVPAIWSRGRALGRMPDQGGLQRVFSADTFWGVAAVLWIVTGLLRAFGGLEKGADYYLGSNVFLFKMGLLGLILLLELWPMVTLIRWRLAVRKGDLPDTRTAPLLARISQVQLILVLLMVFAATALARNLSWP